MKSLFYCNNTRDILKSETHFGIYMNVLITYNFLKDNNFLVNFASRNIAISLNYLISKLSIFNMYLVPHKLFII